MFDKIRNAVDKASSRSSKAPGKDDNGMPIAPAPTADTGLPDAPHAAVVVDKLLVHAAIELAAELISRCPKGRPQDLPIWLESLFSLRAAFARLGLWQDLATVVPDKSLAAAGKSILDDRLDDIFGPYRRMLLTTGPRDRDIQGGILATLILAGWTDDDDVEDFLFRFVRNDGPWLPPSNLLGRVRPWHEPGDRYEDLGRWPISKDVCRQVGLTEKVSTLADLLCLGTGAPLKLGHGDRTTMALLLFAAMHIVCERSPAPRWERFTRLTHAWRSALAARALDWLARQLPAGAFPPEIEALFPQAAERQYV
jgi:hypothetical protein